MALHIWPNGFRKTTNFTIEKSILLLTSKIVFNKIWKKMHLLKAQVQLIQYKAKGVFPQEIMFFYVWYTHGFEWLHQDWCLGISLNVFWFVDYECSKMNIKWFFFNSNLSLYSLTRTLNHKFYFKPTIVHQNNKNLKMKVLPQAIKARN